MKGPLVSVIIPTYNSAQYLLRALSSVANQNYQNWEAIIVDNHSLDNTEDIVKSFNDDRIKLLKIHNHGIIAASRNLAIKSAAGDWLAFLDADDAWEPEKLSEVARCFSGSDLIFHDMLIDYEQKRSLFQKKILKGRKLKTPVMIDLLVAQNPIVNSSVVVRAKLVNKIGGISEEPSMVGCEDYNAWLRISRLTNRFVYIAKSLGVYAVHDGNFSKKLSEGAIKSATGEFLGSLSESDRKKIRACEIYTRMRLETYSEKIDLRDLLRCVFSARSDVAIKCLIVYLKSRLGSFYGL